MGRGTGGGAVEWGLCVAATHWSLVMQPCGRPPRDMAAAAVVVAVCDGGGGSPGLASRHAVMVYNLRLQQHNAFAHGSVPSNDVQNQSYKQESQATFLPDIARHESDTMTKASINMDQAVLEPMLNKHNLVAFLVNMGWVLIRRRDYIDAFIHNQPYNSVQILFETATKVSIYI